MPQVKEVNGSRPTRSAGKTTVKAPVAASGKPARTAPKAPKAPAARTAAPPAQAKPVTAPPARKAAAKVVATPAKGSPRASTRTLAKADGRAGDESRRSTTSKKVKVRAKAPAKVVKVRGKAAPVRKGRKALPIGKVKPEPVRGVKIRELNPQEKCGPGTSVLQLFRVDESLGRELTTHLVFFDRHGWYCEHGRTCRAVADVQKLGKRMVVGL